MSRWVNEGGGSINLKTERRRENESERTMRERVKPPVALISGVVSALIKALRHPRVRVASGMCSCSLQKGDQSEPVAATQMLRCTITNTHTCTEKRQWWIRKRSDSLAVADSPHLHNKLAWSHLTLFSPLRLQFSLLSTCINLCLSCSPTCT